ncbi:tRNA pseudouridine(38-40) synthase TruA [Candidatus Omnitrophota bacterium]
MRNIKLTIEYDGSSYSGWQFQKNSKSVQRTIERHLKKILSEKVRLIGASRTDAGVHARGQAANFRTRSALKARSIMMALNSNLPEDIKILSSREVGPDFSSQFDARSKLYRYTISNASSLSPFMNRYAARVVRRLDISRMQKAAGSIVGRRDFRSFQTKTDRKVRSKKTVKKISMTKKGRLIVIDIEADGFLYNMARSIVGTLIEVGRGKLEPRMVKKIIASRDRNAAGPTAPAKGLCLIRVRY